MPNDLNPNDPRSLWQNQAGEQAVTLDDVRRQAARLERRIYWRNLREYAAGAIVIPVFAANVLRSEGWRVAAPLLMIAGTIYVLFQLYRRTTTKPLPEEMGLRNSLEFHIRELERQRNALRTVWVWYLFPFVPGLLAELIVAAADHGFEPRLILFASVAVVFFIGVWRWNESAASKLDHRIQEMRSMAVDL